MSSDTNTGNPPPRRFIDLPAIDKRVPLSAYIKAIRAAKENPERTFTTGLTTWWPTSGVEVLEQFRRGMHERINEGVPYTQRGRS